MRLVLVLSVLLTAACGSASVTASQANHPNAGVSSSGGTSPNSTPAASPGPGGSHGVGWQPPSAAPTPAIVFTNLPGRPEGNWVLAGADGHTIASFGANATDPTYAPVLGGGAVLTTSQKHDAWAVIQTDGTATTLPAATSAVLQRLSNPIPLNGYVGAPSTLLTSDRNTAQVDTWEAIDLTTGRVTTLLKLVDAGARAVCGGYGEIQDAQQSTIAMQCDLNGTHIDRPSSVVLDAGGTLTITAFQGPAAAAVVPAYWQPGAAGGFPSDVSSDGTTVAYVAFAADGNSGDVHLADVASGHDVTVAGATAVVAPDQTVQYAFSPDNTRVVVHADHSMLFLSSKDGSRLAPPITDGEIIGWLSSDRFVYSTGTGTHGITLSSKAVFDYPSSVGSAQFVLP